ncbi:hypothetical protein LCGC14_2143420, partial [marine sediment metagenome]
MNVTLGDRAVEPAGESKSEWDIFKLLSEKVAERAKERGFESYRDGTGKERRLDTLAEEWTLDGAIEDEEAMADEMLRDCAFIGTLPPDTTLPALREKGTIRFTNWGLTSMALGQASELRPNETHAPFRLHVEKGEPYPTLTRRAQFYIEHPWFMEADEALPRHKEPPKMGGDYPLHLTSGHIRHSIHAMNMTNPVLLETHRGHPSCFLSPQDAAARGLADDEEVRVHNDFGSYRVYVKIASSVRPGQIILYNGWEAFMHPGWRGGNEVE